MTFVKTLKNAGLWQSLEVVVSALIQLGYFSVMARQLSKESFGTIAIANGFLLFGIIFTEGGMGPALIQKKNVTVKHINAAFQSTIIIGLLFFLLLFSTSKSISQFYQIPELVSVLRVLGINFFIMAISSISLSMLQKNFKFKEASIVTIASTMIGYSTGIFLAYKGFGVWSLVVASIVSSLLKAVGFLFHSPIVFKTKLYIKEWRELFSFGSGMILIKISNYLGNGGLNLILGKIFAPDILGIFERTYLLKNLPSTYLGNIMDKIMFPWMSRIQDDEKYILKIYEYGLGLSNSILIPLTIYLSFFSKEIVLVFLGESWNQAIVPLQIMFTIIPFSISSRMSDSLLRAKGYVYKNVLRKYIYVSILIGSVVFSSIYFGIVGVAVAVAISNFTNYILMIFLINRLFNDSSFKLFWIPFRTGIALSLPILILISIYKIITINSGWDSILPFILFSLLLLITSLLPMIVSPRLYGKYIFEIISEIRTK